MAGWLLPTTRLVSSLCGVTFRAALAFGHTFVLVLLGRYEFFLAANQKRSK
jgi:hypothetical protein